MWLTASPDPVLAFLHLPESSRSSDTAVLVLGPFGWDEVCSYRARRAWAMAIADAGHAAARLDLPATGDSGGSPQDLELLTSWTAAVTVAASWLRERTEAARVVALGIGLGGMLGYSAAAAGAPIDDFVLWAVPARGRALLRALRAQAAVISGRHPEDQKESPSSAGTAFEAAGFVVTDELAGALERLDLTALTLPPRPGRRALLLGREGLAPDKRLREHLERAGVPTETADGSGFDAMMEPPQEARTPTEVVAATVAWLGRGARDRDAAGQRLAPPASGLERDVAELRWEGHAIYERAVWLQAGPARVFGVITEPREAPVAPVCAVLLNAGAIRRIGPNRTWVELARRWAARGIPTLRVDLTGIGDTDGDERRYERDAGLYEHDLTEQVRELLTELPSVGLPERFVLAGLCSGAHWALHAAVGNPKVAAALTVNLYPVFWRDELHDEWETRTVVASLRGPAWRRLLLRDVDVRDLARAVRSLRPGRLSAGRRAQAAQAKDVDRVLDTLRDQGTQLLLLLGRDEPLYAQFVRERRVERLDEWPNVTLERIPSADHMFRALWVQRHVLEALERGLDRALRTAAAPTASAQ